MIEFLYGINHHINGMNSGRRTALYYAANMCMPYIMNLLLDNGADPEILPRGRKTWEDFITNEDILLRLHQAGYRKRNTDPEVKLRIRHALGAQVKHDVQSRSVSFVLDESVSPLPDRSISPLPDPSISSILVPTVPSLLEQSSSSIPAPLAAPTQQPYGQKRKVESIRSGAKSFWQRVKR